jgi:hypothetical protein
MNLLSLPLESLPPLCRAGLMIKIAIVVACCGLCSSVPAVDPPPDGAYPNNNTAEGTNALTYSAMWSTDGEQSPIAHFKAWTQRYMTAIESNKAASAALVGEGVQLAKAHRALISNLISSDPAQAIAASVPNSIRAALPTEVSAELETRVAGLGDLSVLASLGTNAHGARPLVEQFVRMNGQTYRAYVYGRRLGQTTKTAIPLHGVVVNNRMAVHEASLRELEPNENVGSSNPALGRAPSTTAPSLQSPVSAELAGVTYSFMSRRDLLDAEARLEAAEAGSRPATNSYSRGRAGKYPSEHI